MTNRQLRELLFNRYAANLTSIHPEAQDIFLCPFCHTGFTRLAIECDPPILSLAHCIPKSLRGKRLTLVCTKCDTAAGTLLDRHLKTRLEVDDFFVGKSTQPRRIDFRVGDHTVRADHFIRKGGDGNLAHDIKIDGKNSPPHSLQALHDGIHDGSMSNSNRYITFDDIGFDLFASQLSLLRAGFLTMFKYFGYGYILHPHLRQVRLQIFEPQKRILPGRPVVTILTPGLPPNKIGIVTKPKNLQCFFVTMQLRTDAKTDVQMAVMLPGLDKDGDSIYKRITEDQADKENRKFSMKTLSPTDDDLAEPDACYKALYFWHEVTQSRE
jgi:hypothetical protein